MLWPDSASALGDSGLRDDAVLAQRDHRSRGRFNLANSARLFLCPAAIITVPRI
jgi:hypothetical protein